MEGIYLFGLLKYFYPDLELDPFLVDKQLAILYLFSFLECVFLTLHSLLFLLLIRCLTEMSVQSLSTTITSGSGASD